MVTPTNKSGQIAPVEPAADQLHNIFKENHPKRIAQEFHWFYDQKRGNHNEPERIEALKLLIQNLNAIKPGNNDPQPQLNILVEIDKIDPELFDELIAQLSNSKQNALGKVVYEPIVKDPRVAERIAQTQPETLIKLLRQTNPTSDWADDPHGEQRMPTIFVDHRSELKEGEEPSRAPLVPLFALLAEHDLKAVLNILATSNGRNGSFRWLAVVNYGADLFFPLIPMLMKHSQSAEGRSTVREFFNNIGCNGDSPLLEGEITPTKLLAIYFQEPRFGINYKLGYYAKQYGLKKEEIFQAAKWAAEHLKEGGALKIAVGNVASPLLSLSEEALPLSHPLKRQCLAAKAERNCGFLGDFTEVFQSVIASPEFSLKDLENYLILMSKNCHDLRGFATIAQLLTDLREKRKEDPQGVDALVQRVVATMEENCNPATLIDLSIYEESHRPHLESLAKSLPELVIKLLTMPYPLNYGKGLKRFFLEDLRLNKRPEEFKYFNALIKSAYQSQFTGTSCICPISEEKKQAFAKTALEKTLIDEDDPLYPILLNLVPIQDLPALISYGNGLEFCRASHPAIISRLQSEIASPGNSLEDLEKCLCAYFTLINSSENILALFLPLGAQRKNEQGAVDALLHKFCLVIEKTLWGVREITDIVDPFEGLKPAAYREFARSHPIAAAWAVKILKERMGYENEAPDRFEPLTKRLVDALLDAARAVFKPQINALLDAARAAFKSQFNALQNPETKQARASQALRAEMFDSSDPFNDVLLSMATLHDFTRFMRRCKTIDPQMTKRLKEEIASRAVSSDDPEKCLFAYVKLEKCLFAYFKHGKGFLAIPEVFKALDAAGMGEMKGRVLEHIAERAPVSGVLCNGISHRLQRGHSNPRRSG